MQFLSFADIEMGLKQKIYRFLNKADGKALVWDAQKRQYIGHVDLPSLQRDAADAGIDLAEWVRYGDSGWGSNGW